ncbi:transposase (fragment) [Paraburkholderia piptadeniae]|uniref:Transposase n=1 Tax=Paraburkholderia piptadeniae TaxID=1701573 RepID=A0A1N7SGD9_9BURK
MNKKPSKFSPEVRERAVPLVREQRSEHLSMLAAVESIALRIGCTPQTQLDGSNARRLGAKFRRTVSRVPRPDGHRA